MATKEDLKRLQSMTLDEKINHAANMLLLFHIKTSGKMYFSFSGGKDSTVLLHLSRIYLPNIGNNLFKDIPAVFVDTGLEYPEVRKFVQSFDNVEIIRPKMNFIEVIQNYGYPLISKEVSQTIYGAKNCVGGAKWKKLHGEILNKDGGKSRYDHSKYLPLSELPVKISDRCCNVMKKSPAKCYEKQSDANPIVATMAQESFFRKNAWIKNGGCNSFDTTKGKGKSAPISPWTEQDVLQYIRKNNVEIASVYGEVRWVDKNGYWFDTNPFEADMKLACTGCSRTGCMFCAYGAHLEKGETRFQRLKRTHPRQYEFMMGGGEWKKENGSELWIPNKKGLGFAKVFDMVNDIYGKQFYRYE